MWRDRIIETKKVKGISIQMMAERTPSHLTVETISRILNTKTEDPRIGTVLALGESVGLSPWELFADPTTLVAYQGFVALQTEVDELKVERDSILAENAALKNKVETLRDKIDHLHDEIIRLHSHYNKQNSNN